MAASWVLVVRLSLSTSAASVAGRRSARHVSRTAAKSRLPLLALLVGQVVGVQ